MLQKLHRKRLSSILCLVLILAMLLSANAFAITTYYAGSYSFSLTLGGDDPATVKSYLRYNSNTASYIDIFSLVAWVDNNSTSIPVKCVYFLVTDGTQSKYTPYILDGSLIPDVSPGTTNRRIEVEWSSVSGGDTIYYKNGSSSYVYADICAGYSFGAIGGWEIFCYPSTFSAYSHS